MRKVVNRVELSSRDVATHQAEFNRHIRQVTRAASHSCRFRRRVSHYVCRRRRLGSLHACDLCAGGSLAALGARCRRLANVRGERDGVRATLQGRQANSPGAFRWRESLPVFARDPQSMTVEAGMAVNNPDWTEDARTRVRWVARPVVYISIPAISQLMCSCAGSVRSRRRSVTALRVVMRRDSAVLDATSGFRTAAGYRASRSMADRCAHELGVD